MSRLWSKLNGMLKIIGSLNSDNFSTYGGEMEIETQYKKANTFHSQSTELMLKMKMYKSCRCPSLIAHQADRNALSIHGKTAISRCCRPSA